MGKQRAFLAAFAGAGTCRRRASRAAWPSTVYNWLEQDEAFARLFDDARQTATDVLEAECRRRALQGVRIPCSTRVRWWGTCSGIQTAAARAAECVSPGEVQAPQERRARTAARWRSCTSPTTPT